MSKLQKDFILTSFLYEFANEALNGKSYEAKVSGKRGRGRLPLIFENGMILGKGQVRVKGTETGGPL